PPTTIYTLFLHDALPIYAIEQLDLRSFDLIISSSSAVAKGVLTNSNQVHICYCHSPMRYAWDLYHQYLSESKFGFLSGFYAKYRSEEHTSELQSRENLVC